MLELIAVVCFVGKLVGSMVAGLCYKMTIRDAFCLGLMLNIRGVIEIAFINNWGDSQVRIVLIMSGKAFYLIFLLFLFLSLFRTVICR